MKCWVEKSPLRRFGKYKVEFKVMFSILTGRLELHFSNICAGQIYSNKFNKKAILDFFKKKLKKNGDDGFQNTNPDQFFFGM